jgi:protocatechuate 3,4-dioxygenase beta subunit
VSTIDLSGVPEGKSSAAVEGRVVDADGGPVPGARVTVMRGFDFRGATSDASGVFMIGNLPAGTARVTVSKPGFSMVESDPTTSGLSVSLNEGERRQGVVLRMVPGSEITGSVLDEFGEPVERAMVRLLRMSVSADGSVRPVSAGVGGSDDRGRYRIPRVAPGVYALLTQGDIPNQGQTYLYYPGVVSSEAAHMLEVPEGRDVTGIDFRLNPDLGHRLAGTVVDSTGHPLSGGSVELTGTDARGVTIQRRIASLTGVGALEFLNVAPGRYTVSVRSQPSSPVPPIVNGRVVRPVTVPESGAVQIQVGDTPPDRVVIRTAPGTPAPPR